MAAMVSPDFRRRAGCTGGASGGNDRGAGVGKIRRIVGIVFESVRRSGRAGGGAGTRREEQDAHAAGAAARGSEKRVGDYGDSRCRGTDGSVARAASSPPHINPVGIVLLGIPTPSLE